MIPPPPILSRAQRMLLDLFLWLFAFAMVMEALKRRSEGRR